MGLKLFITGTGGYFGSVLASQLAAMPEVDGITGVDSASRQPAFPEKVKCVKMDIRSPELAGAMSGHDFVIHTACIVQWPAKIPRKVRDDINFNGTRNVAQAAVKSGVRGFLQTSSVAAYDPVKVQGKRDMGEDGCPIGKGNSSMYYWNIKSKTERILTETLASTNVTLTLFRIATIIGPSSPVTLQGLRENALLVNGHDPLTGFVHETDAAQAFSLAILRDMPGAYNVVTDDFIRMSEFYNMIGAIPVRAPLWISLFASYLRWRFSGSIIHPSWIRSYLMDFTLSNAKLKAAGWKPKYSCVEAIRSVL